jgi:F0F1-type ATP synthase membrane subunit c/vacuolar-type H+-ATPase subunit K
MLVGHEGKDEIEKGYRRLYIIWMALVASLFFYILICHMLGDAYRQNIKPGYPYETMQKSLLLVSIVQLGLSLYFRKFLLSSRSSVHKSKLTPRISSQSVSPELAKYFIAVLVTNALSESIGIFGFVLFLLGDTYETLYLFMAISTVAMIYHRPKKDELLGLVEDSKGSNRSNA